ncbi:MAG: RnfABCDGE type electron transport complex subunit B [Candidatus Faecousia sp.]|nr:RnfABCDGE type electron transport complex subunit B [Candidatus Faecousia sp.]
MQTVMISTLVIGLVGLILGLALVTASKKFYVEVDDRVTQVRECLRGSNCGACGYAGCDAVAEAIVKGEARVDACPGNSTENIAKIAAILGKEAIDQDPQCAYVQCAGTCEATRAKAEYVGIQDCRSAVLSGLPYMSCEYGCLGLGSCVKVCPQGAISIKDGIAVVNPRLCVGCGLCAKTCPKGIIGMHDRTTKVAVRCSNKNKGPVVKKACSAGCIGCGICAKQCEQGAITVENNLSRVDPEKCIGCGKCVEKCPTKSIRFL